MYFQVKFRNLNDGVFHNFIYYYPEHRYSIDIEEQNYDDIKANALGETLNEVGVFRVDECKVVQLNKTSV